MLPGRLNLEVARGVDFSKQIELWQPTSKIKINQLTAGEVVYFNGLPEVVYKITHNLYSYNVYLRNGVIGDPVFASFPDDEIYLANKEVITSAVAKFETIIDPVDHWDIKYVTIPTTLVNGGILINIPADLTKEIPTNSYSWDLSVELTGRGLVRLLEGTMIVTSTDSQELDYRIPPENVVAPV